MLTALQVGNDASLLKTRAGVIESAGLAVVSAMGVEEALERAESQAFDAAILCHSLRVAERIAIAAAVRRRNPSAPVLLVATARDSRESTPVAIDVVADAHPQKLVQALRSVLRLSGREGAEASVPIPINQPPRQP